MDLTDDEMAARARDAQALDAIAQGGRDDETSRARVRGIFDAHPELWRDRPELAGVARELWIGVIVGPHPVEAEALRRRAGAMELELAGEDAPLLVRMLAERVVSAWLQVQYVEVGATAATAPEEARRGRAEIEAAERRFARATTALTTARKLLPPGGPAPVAPAPLTISPGSSEETPPESPKVKKRRGRMA